MARKLINMKKFYIFIEDSFFSFFVNNINVCYFIGTFSRRNYQHHKAGSDSFKFRRRCQILELFEIRERVSIVYFFSKESYRSAKFSEVKEFLYELFQLEIIYSLACRVIIVNLIKRVSNLCHFSDITRDEEIWWKIEPYPYFAAKILDAREC